MSGNCFGFCGWQLGATCHQNQNQNQNQQEKTMGTLKDFTLVNRMTFGVLLIFIISPNNCCSSGKCQNTMAQKDCFPECHSFTLRWRLLVFCSICSGVDLTKIFPPLVPGIFPISGFKLPVAANWVLIGPVSVRTPGWLAFGSCDLARFFCSSVSQKGNLSGDWRLATVGPGLLLVPHFH